MYFTHELYVISKYSLSWQVVIFYTQRKNNKTNTIKTKETFLANQVFNECFLQLGFNFLLDPAAGSFNRFPEMSHAGTKSYRFAVLLLVN